MVSRLWEPQTWSDTKKTANLAAPGTNAYLFFRALFIQPLHPNELNDQL